MGLISAISNIASDVVDHVSDAADDVKDAVTDVVKDVGNAVEDVVDDVGGALTDLTEQMSEQSDRGFFGKLSDGIKSLGDTIGNAFNAVVDTIGDAAKKVAEVAEKAVQAAADVAKKAAKAAADVVKATKDAVKNVAKGVVDLAKTAVDVVKTGVSTSVNVLKAVGSNLLEGDLLGAVKDGVKEYTDGAKKVVSDLVQGGKNMLNTVIEAGVGVLKSAVKTVAGEAAASKIAGAVDFGAKLVAGAVTGVADSAVALVTATSNIATGKGSLSQNLGSAALAGLDIVTTFASGGATAMAKGVAKTAMKVAAPLVKLATPAVALAKGAGTVAKNSDVIIAATKGAMSSAKTGVKTGAELAQSAATKLDDIAKPIKETLDTGLASIDSTIAKHIPVSDAGSRAYSMTKEGVAIYAEERVSEEAHYAADSLLQRTSLGDSFVAEIVHEGIDRGIETTRNQATRQGEVQSSDMYSDRSPDKDIQRDARANTSDETHSIENPEAVSYRGPESSIDVDSRKRLEPSLELDSPSPTVFDSYKTDLRDRATAEILTMTDEFATQVLTTLGLENTLVGDAIRLHMEEMAEDRAGGVFDSALNRAEGTFRKQPSADDKSANENMDARSNNEEALNMRSDIDTFNEKTLAFEQSDVERERFADVVKARATEAIVTEITEKLNLIAAQAIATAGLEGTELGDYILANVEMAIDATSESGISDGLLALSPERMIESAIDGRRSERQSVMEDALGQARVGVVDAASEQLGATMSANTTEFLRTTGLTDTAVGDFIQRSADEAIESQIEKAYDQGVSALSAASLKENVVGQAEIFSQNPDLMASAFVDGLIEKTPVDGTALEELFDHNIEDALIDQLQSAMDNLSNPHGEFEAKLSSYETMSDNLATLETLEASWEDYMSSLDQETDRRAAEPS